MSCTGLWRLMVTCHTNILLCNFFNRPLVSVQVFMTVQPCLGDTTDVHELSRILFEVLRCGSVHAHIWCHPSTVEHLSAGLRSVKKLTQQNVYVTWSPLTSAILYRTYPSLAAQRDQPKQLMQPEHFELTFSMPCHAPSLASHDSSSTHSWYLKPSECWQTM